MSRSSKHQGRPYDQTVVPEMSLTPDVSNEFKSTTPDRLLPHGLLTPERQQPQAGNKGEWRVVAKISSALYPWWNTILVTSCVIAVLFDPLFFYIPYTSEEQKCMAIDKSVKNAALVFRSVTDFIFLLHIIYQLSEAIKYATSPVQKDTDEFLQWESESQSRMIRLARKLSWRFFLVDVFSILPLPQLLIVRLFFDMGGSSDYLLRRKVVSGIVFVQYVPRIFRIYLWSVAVIESPLWVKGVFNFFLYILASHVLGAFWYFFSIQREISCWYQTCIDTKRSESDCTFYCNDHRHSDLMTSTAPTNNFNGTLNENCILKVPYNMTDPPFDFGIFFDALKNDIQGKINFPQKIGYCFWWGLRNLSSFGTGLVTSTHLWENSFAVLISIVGLLLFLYLIGNVQIYMARETGRKEDLRDKMKAKKTDIEKWAKKNDLSDDIQKEIMRNIEQTLEQDINANLKDLFAILPWYTKKYLKRALCMKAIEKIPMLKQMDGRVWKLMCDYLKPVNYPENTMVFQMGKPLDRMVFITDGSMLTYTTATESSHSSGTTIGRATSTPMDVHPLEKGAYYGHELLEYASQSRTEQLPTSPENVQCQTNVEAFVLMAKDLKTVVSKCEEYWHPTHEGADQVAPLEGQFRQQVPRKRVTTSNINPTGR